MFKVFQKILQNQTVTEQEGEKVQEFVLLRWLSGDPRLANLTSTLNTLGFNLPSHILCNAIARALRGQIRFIKYPKGENPTELEEVTTFARYYNVSLTEAREYLEFCQRHCPEEIQTLKTIFREE